jgi:predicted enzyme related to lactoylglutathione lyase
MVAGGNATIFISNMDRAVQFYTEVLGMKLTNRFGDHWATVEIPGRLTIGLHPASAKYPAPGTKGSMMIGLDIEEDISRVVSRLAEKGVHIKGSIAREQSGNFAHLEDPDGNELYLWEHVAYAPQETELEAAGVGKT